jgi:tRNA-dihydrouridine synthase
MSLELKKTFFVLAPMDDVTDTVFRQIISQCAAPDMCFSEFVNVDGLMSQGRSRLLTKLDRSEVDEPPLVAHIWGLKPKNFYGIARQIATGELASELGLKENFAGIDLNMGCPVKTVVKAGACSALINNHALAKEIIDATKQGADNRLPVSVKTRLGYASIDPNWIQFLLSQQLFMLTVHLRTTKEMSLVPAHYEALTWVKQLRDKLSPATLLVANGDILNRRQGELLATKYGLDGIMIGRGVFHDPYAFSVDSPWAELAAKNKLDLFERHLTLFMGSVQNSDKMTKRLNKYAKIYINGFDGARELREKLTHANTIQEMLDIIFTSQTELTNR